MSITRYVRSKWIQCQAVSKDVAGYILQLSLSHAGFVIHQIFDFLSHFNSLIKAISKNIPFCIFNKVFVLSVRRLWSASLQVRDSRSNRVVLMNIYAIRAAYRIIENEPV